MSKPFPPCTMPGCDKLSRSGKCGLCESHYRKAINPPRPPILCRHPGCSEKANAKRYYMCAAHFVSRLSPCTIKGCDKTVQGHGLCYLHYNRVRRAGDPRPELPSRNEKCKNKRCDATGCELPLGTKLVWANGKVYCNKHYYRWKKWGDPLLLKRPPLTPEERKQRRAATNKRYHSTPHGKLRLRFNKAKLRAMKYGSDWETGIPKEVFIELYNRTHCDICGFFMPKGDRTLDHIVPLSGGGPNAPSNLQTVHMACNSRKGGVRKKRVHYWSPPLRPVTD